MQSTIPMVLAVALGAWVSVALASSDSGGSPYLSIQNSTIDTYSPPHMVIGDIERVFGPNYQLADGYVKNNVPPSAFRIVANVNQVDVCGVLHADEIQMWTDGQKRVWLDRAGVLRYNGGEVANHNDVWFAALVSGAAAFILAVIWFTYRTRFRLWRLRGYKRWFGIQDVEANAGPYRNRPAPPPPQRPRRPGDAYQPDPTRTPRS